MPRGPRVRPPLDVASLPRPRALDLFCCGGGAGHGLRTAGFRTVVGMDIDPTHKESYEHLPGMHFFAGDVAALDPAWIKEHFDFVWGSPPCQFATTMVFKAQKQERLDEWQANGKHINHIPTVRALVGPTGVPYCIENVTGARKFMRAPLLKLCGTMFPEARLKVFRHRFFEFGNGLSLPPQPTCHHEGRALAGQEAERVRAPRTERYQSGAVAKLRAGEAPAGFAGVEKHLPSRRGDRADRIYGGRDAATTEKLRALYGRDYARSIKEALRATGELVALSAAECAEERARYEREIAATLPTPGVERMFAIYGLTKTRGLTDEWRDAMGMQWRATRHEIREAIPPAYSHYIATHALRQTGHADAACAASKAHHATRRACRASDNVT